MKCWQLIWRDNSGRLPRPPCALLRLWRLPISSGMQPGFILLSIHLHTLNFFWLLHFIIHWTCFLFCIPLIKYIYLLYFQNVNELFLMWFYTSQTSAVSLICFSLRSIRGHWERQQWGEESFRRFVCIIQARSNSVHQRSAGWAGEGVPLQQVPVPTQACGNGEPAQFVRTAD